MSLGPLRFEPMPRPLIWGGRRLATLLGRDLPDGDVGESWDLVDLPDAVSIVTDGPHAGRSIRALIEERPAEVLGSTRPAPDGGFPLLVKLLDAHRMLSVQVHPDEAAAAAQGARPKAEAWFVLHTEPDARILLGLKAGVDAAQVRAAAQGDGLSGLLVEHRPRPGDIFLIEPGTVHCLGAGVVLVEVQQPSDTTYRLYDWGRGRPLHLEQALDSIHWGRPAPVSASEVRCQAFDARWVRSGGIEREADHARVVIATSEGRLSWHAERQPLRAGDTVLLPASCPDVRIEGADYVRARPDCG